MLMRLNKFLAQAGVASRRKADLLIEAGKVEVDGSVVLDLGTKIDPDRDTVMVDRQKITLPEAKVLYTLYKPKGIISSVKDERGRKTVIDLVPAKPRVFPVGRLDQGAEGLILLTNDGDWAQKLAHPKYAIRKIYQIWLEPPSQYDLEQILQQLGTKRRLGDQWKQFDQVHYIGRDRLGLKFEVALHEGLKHQVKRLVGQAGLNLAKLKRIAYGDYQLGNLQPGQWQKIELD